MVVFFKKTKTATVDGTFLKRIAIGLLIIASLFLSLAGFSLYRSRINNEQRIFVTANNLAAVYTQSIHEIIAKIDVVLLDIKEDVEHLSLNRDMDGSILDQVIARHSKNVPELKNIRLTNQRGKVVYGVTEAEGKGAKVYDRDYFIRLRSNPAAELVISKPLVSRIHGQWLLVFARRVNMPDGTFGGVLMGAVTLDYLNKLLSSVDIGSHGGISLRDGEMGIIARHPAPKDIGSIIGNKNLSPELKKMFDAGEPAGTFYTPKSWDNVAKVVSYRKVEGYPLYINVGIAAEDYLPAWRSEVIKILALSILFLLVVSGFAWILYHDMAEQKEKLREAADTIKKLEGILPICSYCKKIRNDQGDWTQMEAYISQHSNAYFSHGYCPDCAKKAMKEVEDYQKNNPKE